MNVFTNIFNIFLTSNNQTNVHVSSAPQQPWTMFPNASQQANSIGSSYTSGASNASSSSDALNVALFALLLNDDDTVSSSKKPKKSKQPEETSTTNETTESPESDEPELTAEYPDAEIPEETITVPEYPPVEVPENTITPPPVTAPEQPPVEVPETVIVPTPAPPAPTEPNRPAIASNPNQTFTVQGIQQGLSEMNVTEIRDRKHAAQLALAAADGGYADAYQFLAHVALGSQEAFDWLNWDSQGGISARDIATAASNTDTGDVDTSTISERDMEGRLNFGTLYANHIQALHDIAAG